MLENIFKAILITSFIGTISAIGLTLIKPVTKKHFSASWHYYIWLVVLITMIIPFRFVLPGRTFEENIQKIETVQQTNHIEKNPVLEFVKSEKALSQTYENSIRENKNGDKTGFTIDSFGGLSTIWFFGAVAFFVFKMFGYVLFIIKLRKETSEISCQEIKQFTHRKIRTRRSEKISSPLMLGILRPTLILPETKMTGEQLYSVLAHEMMHFKRKDILYKWFVCIVKCIHWFNPAVYYIARQVNIECEISCDMAVVKDMGEEQENCYINTILALVTAKNRRISTVTTAMAGDKKMLKRRFSMIKNKRKISKKAVIISAVTALVIILGTVLASGFLNGKLIAGYENELMALNTDARQGEDFNFLILGLDEQDRADTIMILQVQGEEITGISVPRETLFVSEGVEATANEILRGENGDQKLIDAVKKAMAMPITYYAKMNLTAVENLIDSVGGIEFDVPMDMEYDDPEQNLHIKIKQGRHTLNGSAVCGLLQFRQSNNGNGYGNAERIKIGQQVVKEFVDQKLNKDFINKAPEIFKNLADNIKTNYPVSKLAGDVKLIDRLKDRLVFTTLSGTSISDDSGFVLYEEEKGEIVSMVSEPKLVPKNHNKKNAKTEPEADNMSSTETAWESMVMPCEGVITSSFGKRVHPITNEERVHNGIDIKAPLGAEVVSSISGTVTDVGYDAEKGNYIVVERNNVKTTYSQLSATNVKKGDSVSASQPIGEVGSTGASTGAHLHFEVMLDGEFVNPESLIQK